MKRYSGGAGRWGVQYNNTVSTRSPAIDKGIALRLRIKEFQRFIILMSRQSTILHFADGVNLRYYTSDEKQPIKHQLMVVFEDESALAVIVAMYYGSLILLIFWLLHKSSEYLFFPGCQLPASEPELVPAIYKNLTERLDGGVGLMLSCCGIIAKWAGREETFIDVSEKIKKAWKELGKPKIIAGCPMCARTTSEEHGLPCRTVFEALCELGLPKDCGGLSGNVSLHHACGARYDEKLHSEIRHLAGALGLKLSSDQHAENQSPCCGYGGLTPFVSSEIAGEITDNAIGQVGGRERPVLTYCVNCRDRYLAAGVKSSHLLELIYGSDVYLRHRSPTWSERQE